MQSNKRDTLIWVASNNGKYNVKNGYKAILEANRSKSMDIPLKLCWDPSFLPKVGFFLWLAIQNRILSMDRLNILGIQGPSRCVLYQQSAKNMDHLLYLCPYSQRCWEWLKQMLGWCSPFQKSFIDLLRGWPSNIVNGVYSKLYFSFYIDLGNLEGKKSPYFSQSGTQTRESYIQTRSLYCRNY